MSHELIKIFSSSPTLECQFNLTQFVCWIMKSRSTFTTEINSELFTKSLIHVKWYLWGREFKRREISRCSMAREVSLNHGSFTMDPIPSHCHDSSFTNPPVWTRWYAITPAPLKPKDATYFPLGKGSVMGDQRNKETILTHNSTYYYIRD